MTMTKKLNGNTLAVTVEGRLDTLTAPSLEAPLLPALDGIKSLVVDFKDLTYISSAGIRVLVQAAQIMVAQSGEIKIINANNDIKGLFKMTGLIDVLGVE